MQRAKVECWVVVDANGDWSVGRTEDDAVTRHEEEYGDLHDMAGFRMVKVPVSVPLPEPVELPEVEVAPLGEPSLA